MEFSAEMIAAYLGGEVVGDPAATVRTIAKIEEGTEGALAFLSNPKYETHLYTSRASIVIVNRDFQPQQEVSATLIKVEDAYGSFARLLDLYMENKPRKTGISSLAFVDPSASVGENVYLGEFAVVGRNVTVGNNVQIYPQAYIGDNVVLGDDTIVYAGAKIYEDCRIGSHVTIHSGAVIGADGFGFAPQENGEFKKIPQIGNVLIEDWVEIGANTTVDRATMGSTVIKRGAKLDSQLQVGHNAVIGENSVFAAQVGIAGSTKVGRNCMFGGQVGIAGHLTIADRTQLASKTGISNSIRKEGQVYMGYPGFPASAFQRSFIVMKQLPDLRNTVLKLEKELAALKEKLSE